MVTSFFVSIAWYGIISSASAYAGTDVGWCDAKTIEDIEIWLNLGKLRLSWFTIAASNSVSKTVWCAFEESVNYAFFGRPARGNASVWWGTLHAFDITHR